MSVALLLVSIMIKYMLWDVCRTEFIGLSDLGYSVVQWLMTIVALASAVGHNLVRANQEERLIPAYGQSSASHNPPSRLLAVFNESISGLGRVRMFDGTACRLMPIDR